MTIAHALMMLGGLGMLLYGMKMMSGGLETFAGDKLQVVLRKATSNRVMAVFVGILATIAINSSTATTIMTVGFVNSGLLNLTQSIGIIMGANVGTTFSAQLIAFGMTNISLTSIAALFIFIGAAMYVFFTNKEVKNIGFIVLGFGIMFFGVAFMSDAMRPLRADPAFREFLVSFQNPLLALLAGFIVTAIVQSSTATTAMLIALLATTCYCFTGNDFMCTHCLGIPAIPFQTTAFILLGVNIGTSLTTVIASIPASRESKRAALFHIQYDIIGSAVFGALILIFPAILTFFTTTWSAPPQQAAMFHTLYNVATMLLLLPFIKHIATLMNKIVPVVEQKTDIMYENKLIYLDNQTKTTPTLAVINAHLEICRTWKIANENLNLAMEAFFERNAETAKKVIEYEKTVDYLHHNITTALVDIIDMKLSPDEAKKIGDMFVILSEVEQIGDRAESIAGYALSVIENNTAFTDEAIDELKTVNKVATELMSMALGTYEKQDKSQFPAIKALEDKIDEQMPKFAENHFIRLKDKNCKPRSGIIFMDILSDLKNSAGCAEKIVSL